LRPMIPTNEDYAMAEFVDLILRISTPVKVGWLVCAVWMAIQVAWHRHAQTAADARLDQVSRPARRMASLDRAQAAARVARREPEPPEEAEPSFEDVLDSVLDSASLREPASEEPSNATLWARVSGPEFTSASTDPRREPDVRPQSAVRTTQPA